MPGANSFPAKAMERRVLTGAAVVYGTLWLAVAIDPNDRFDWFIENLLVVVAVAAIAASYRWYRLSIGSYLLIATFLALHAVGAHYTYSETPFGDHMKSIFGWQRNHYDRLVHFCFGLLLAYPFFDLCQRHLRPPHKAWSFIFAIASILAMSGLYEILEWLAAEILDPDKALVFLGTQGDVFDGQKDAALAFLGGVVALVSVAALGKRLARTPGGGA